MKKYHQYLALCSCMVLSLTINAQTKTAGTPKMNVLFFLVDDLGWKDISCYGSTFYETPHIDALAKDALKFTRAYSASPVCSPTRAAIMTGKYPSRTGITDYIGAPQPDQWKRNTPMLSSTYADRLALEEYTLAEALKDGGYKTYYAGKWHLGPEGFWPENQGFEINKGGIHKGNPGKGYFSPYDNARLADGPIGEYLPERLARETKDFIRQNKQQPFFIYHNFYLVHSPFLAKKELIEKYEKKRDRLGVKDSFIDDNNRKVRQVQTHATYAAMVEALDNAVGEMVNTLKEEGLYDRTLIIFYSDNGGLSTSEGTPTSNVPLRAGKGWMYEGGIRVPLLIRWPGVTKAGAETSVPVNSPDFYPTILEATGLPLKPQQHLDGKSIVKVLKVKRFKDRNMFFHYPHHGNQGGFPSSSVIQGKWKLIYFFGRNKHELYNLDSDMGEQHDLSVRNSGRTKRMKAVMEKFWEQTGSKFPVPNPNYNPAESDPIR